MPPPSPVPGWASGEVCMERTARRRTVCETLPSGCGFPFIRAGRGAGVVVTRAGGGRRDGAILVLVPERQVDLDEHLLLVLGQERVAQDLAEQVVLGVALLEDAGPDVQRLGRQPQQIGRASCR